MRRILAVMAAVLTPLLLVVFAPVTATAQAGSFFFPQPGFYLQVPDVPAKLQTKPWVDDYVVSTTVLGNRDRVPLYFWFAYNQYSGTPHFTLQKKTASSWHSVKAPVHLTRTKLSVTPPSVTLSSSTKTETVYYRLKSVASTNTSYSPAATFHYENQSRYTGLQKVMYDDLKAYCPKAAVEIGTQAGEGGAYSPGSYEIDVAADVAGYTTADQKTVAVHECAHERQFFNWGGTAAGWKKMVKASKKFFIDDATPAGVPPQESADGGSGTFVPLEHAADCAAYSVDPGGYLGYGGYCNASELHHANRLLHGHRY